VTNQNVDFARVIENFESLKSRNGKSTNAKKKKMWIKTILSPYPISQEKMSAYTMWMPKIVSKKK